MFENCGQKLAWFQEERKKDKNCKFNNKVDREPFAKLPYTNSKSGQAPFGGWNDKGVKHYRKLKMLIAQALELPCSKLIEEKMLELCKEKHAIQSNSPDESKKKRKRKVREEYVSDEDEGDLFDD